MQLWCAKYFFPSFVTEMALKNKDYEFDKVEFILNGFLFAGH